MNVNIQDTLNNVARASLEAVANKRNLAVGVATVLAFAAWPFLLSALVRGYEANILFAGAGTLLAFVAGTWWSNRNRAEESVPFVAVMVTGIAACLVIGSIACAMLRMPGHEATAGALLLFGFGWLAPKL